MVALLMVYSLLRITLQLFMKKILSPNELYQTEFLQGIQEAIHDVQSGRIKEVSTFEDFIA
jgi:hypothetical protein